MQEVTYTTLVEPTRRDLHKRVGEALEELYGDSREEVYDLLARHFAEAHEADKAVDYLLAAGDKARQLYADQEALEHYRQARGFLAQLGDERRARDTLFKMALAHHLAFDFEQAEEAYDEAFCCRVEDLPRPEPTERIETASPPPDDVTPGDVYTSEGGQFISHLFQGLLVVDRELNVIPAMADNMRVSSDGLSYLFRIREEARWSDGEPVEADDFIHAWESIREEEAITAFLMEDIESAKALDARTIEVRLREPRSYFPYILAATWAFPRPKHMCEALGDDWRKPENLVTNGPFMLGELSDDGATLIANPHWAGPRGNVKEIAITFTKRGEELVEEWLDGRFDVLQVLDPRAREAHGHAVRARARALVQLRRVPARRRPVLERARPPGVRARDRLARRRSRSASGSSPRRRRAARSRRRCRATRTASRCRTTRSSRASCSPTPATRTGRACRRSA